MDYSKAWTAMTALVLIIANNVLTSNDKIVNFS